MSEEELRQLLRDMRDDPIPADSLVRVRTGIEERIRNRRRWWLLPALALVVSVAALMMVVLPPVRAPLTSPNLVARKLEFPAATERQPTETRVARAVSRPVDRHPVRPRGVFRKGSIENGGPALIRIETPDPSVLILLVEEKQR